MDTTTLDLPLSDILPNGDAYQNGVRPGAAKLAQFKAALKAQKTPALYTQDGKYKAATVYVRLFDPCGSWSWYLTEWDGDNEAFGYVVGHCGEFGYVPLDELAGVRGQLGIGIELDMHFTPMPLVDALAANA